VAHSFAVASEASFDDFGAVIIGDSDVDEADGFVFCASTGAGDASDSYSYS